MNRRLHRAVRLWVAITCAPILFLGLRNGFGPSAAVGSVLVYLYERVSIKRYNRRPIENPISSRREPYFEETR
jgi:hypothetical protein